jgi:hypothetical protein
VTSPAETKDRRLAWLGPGVTLRTLGVVTLVTVLTWVLAESQTVQQRSVSVEVKFAAGGDQRAVRVSPDQDPGAPRWTGLVEVTLEGAAGPIESVRRALRSGVTLTVGDELSAEPGVRAVDLREALRLDGALAGSGVSIREAGPPRVTLEVRAVEDRTVPVRAVLPEGSDTEVIAVDPAVVTVRGPTTAVPQSGIEAVALVPGESVAGLLPGQTAERVPAAVRVPGLAEAWGVRVTPERVAVSVRARSRVETVVVPSVPVQVLLAPSELDRWSIEVAPEDRDIRDVRVTGPVEQVARVASGDLRLVAVVRISFEELERGVGVKEATLTGLNGTLPAGLRAEADDLSVGLTVEAREGGG